MAKSTYGWPSGINTNILDHEIPLGTKNTVGKMMPVKFIVAVVAWILVNGYYMRILMLNANIFVTVLYFIWVLVAGAFFLRVTKARDLAIMQVGALLAYVPKSSREITTRTTSKPAGFYNIVGIKRIADDGLIEYKDDSFGRAFLVVGSASRLLFDNDRDLIFDSVDNFWRKAPTDVEVIEVTTKEPQRISQQVDALQQRMYNLTTDSEDLRGIIVENFNRMRTVGTKFLSTHQYWVIKSESKESLEIFEGLMLTEVEYAGRVLQGYSGLNSPDAVIKMLKPLYEGRQGFDVRNAQLQRDRAKLSTGAAAGTGANLPVNTGPRPVGATRA